MDADRDDHLTTPQTRRMFGQAAAGLALAGVLTWLTRMEAEQLGFQLNGDTLGPCP